MGKVMNRTYNIHVLQLVYSINAGYYIHEINIFNLVYSVLNFGVLIL